MKYKWNASRDLVVARIRLMYFRWSPFLNLHPPLPLVNMRWWRRGKHLKRLKNATGKRLSMWLEVWHVTWLLRSNITSYNYTHTYIFHCAYYLIVSQKIVNPNIGDHVDRCLRGIMRPNKENGGICTLFALVIKLGSRIFRFNNPICNWGWTYMNEIKESGETNNRILLKSFYIYSLINE